MPLGDLFKLAKLTITGYSDEERTPEQQVGTPLEVQYNPETLSVRHESVYHDPQGVGGTSNGSWSHSSPQRLSVKLVVDGTGVGHMGVQLREVRPVAAQIEQFLSVAYRVNGESHEPLYLKLQWGSAIPDQGGFNCRLLSVDINYLSFDRDGSPLHAELDAVFTKLLTPLEEDKRVGRKSPDLTHRRVVVEGDTLPLLCREIYGSASHYLRVARVNKLDDFRNLTAGQELFFPPFERPHKS